MNHIVTIYLLHVVPEHVDLHTGNIRVVLLRNQGAPIMFLGDVHNCIWDTSICGNTHKRKLVKCYRNDVGAMGLQLIVLINDRLQFTYPGFIATFYSHVCTGGRRYL